jgi:hypothetical protein
MLKEHVMYSTIRKSAVALALAGIAFALGTDAHAPSWTPGEPNRTLAVAFGSLALPSDSTNAAAVLQTFQNPNVVLPLSQISTQIQNRMQSTVPAGTPYWDGTGQMPGAIGTPGFSPKFTWDWSGCNTVSMTFYDVYSPAMTMPTIWCGAVSNQTKPATTNVASNLSGNAAADAPGTATQAKILAPPAI